VTMQNRKKKEKSGRNSTDLPVKPVFLFNTLHNIAALTVINPEKAANTISGLAQFIQLVLELERRPFTILSQEFMCAESYLCIEKARFDDRLEISRDLAPDCMELPIPCFTLLPIVENCVVHAVERSSGLIRVELSAHCVQDHYCIEISDSGPGPDPACPDLLSGVNGGLGFVRSRIRAAYGRRSVLAVEPKKPHGTRVILRLSRSRADTIRSKHLDY